MALMDLPHSICFHRRAQAANADMISIASHSDDKNVWTKQNRNQTRLPNLLGSGIHTAEYLLSRWPLHVSASCHAPTLRPANIFEAASAECIPNSNLSMHEFRTNLYVLFFDMLFEVVDIRFPLLTTCLNIIISSGDIHTLFVSVHCAHLTGRHVFGQIGVLTEPMLQIFRTKKRKLRSNRNRGRLRSTLDHYSTLKESCKFPTDAPFWSMDTSNRFERSSQSDALIH